MSMGGRGKEARPHGRRSSARAPQGRLRAPRPGSRSSPLNAGVIRQASRHHEPTPLVCPGPLVLWSHSPATILARGVSDRIVQNQGQEGSETPLPVGHEVVFASVDDSIRLVRKCGRGSELAKCDIKAAFRFLPIHPEDFPVLGMQLDGAICVESVLPRGCAISCALFEAFRTFLQRVVMKVRGHRAVSHYLDVGEAESGTCDRALRCFEWMVLDMGVPLAPEKTEALVLH
ncbi:hypothetical protein NDU88_004113 [Pleurodeles waltl]|uniref:Reverse transcriptase domain-containing protein n=1 Tax=Pleurodeles waltl TaxID=8319 RepID=A0AAV7VJS4_PLEWA|nr:hypothetical protein NDU88_004113 [Pleurodeles waltl]